MFGAVDEDLWFVSCDFHLHLSSTVQAEENLRSRIGAEELERVLRTETVRVTAHHIFLLAAIFLSFREDN